MLTFLLKHVSVEEAKAQAHLTAHEVNLMAYLQQPRRPTIVPDLASQLGMSQLRLLKTKRSLIRKLEKLIRGRARVEPSVLQKQSLE